jgi:hypothetical protein
VEGVRREEEWQVAGDEWLAEQNPGTMTRLKGRGAAANRTPSEKATSGTPAKNE